MKLTSQRMIGLQTSCLRAFVVILGFVVVPAIISGQETSPAGKDAKSTESSDDPAKSTPDEPKSDLKMPDISGKWRARSWLKDARGELDEVEIKRSADGPEEFELLPQQPVPTDGQAAFKFPIKWVSGTRQFEATFTNDKTAQQISMQLARGSQTMRVTIKVDEATKKEFAARGMSESEIDELLNQEWTRTPMPVGKGDASVNAITVPAGFVGDAELKNPEFGGTGSKGQDGKRAQAIPAIVGTWSRSESGTFSKLTIWPVENRERQFFVECAEGNGLLEWNQTTNNLGGVFAFNLLGDRCAQAYLVLGPKETIRFFVSPFEDQRKELLRSGFAKTQRELDQKLSSDVTRVEVPVEQKPIPTVAVLKTELEPARIRELLRTKYRQQPYRFFSNDTYRSVIVVAPAEAQEDIEVLIHKLDVKEEANSQAAAPNIAQTDSDEVSKPGELLDGELQIRRTEREPSVFSAQRVPVFEQTGRSMLVVGVALPDTPAAKQLVEQLGAQESAAAAEAATIRQLQTNGQAEQNKQPIAEHQRKLKILLSTAFDLKLQLEELQVKELQSRLSRLERQIGQRKELREKIINRRAGELIEGDAMKWDATSPATTKVPGLAMKESAPGAMSSSSTRAAVTKADHIEIDLYAGSQVLPGLGKNPGYSKLVQTLNGLKGVTTNIREAGKGDAIVMAIVRDPSQRCQREARQTQKESELRIAINSALKAAGIEAARWDENAAADNAAGQSPDKAVTQTGSPKPDPKAEMLAKLQGIWDLQTLEPDPENNPDPEVIRVEVEVKGNLMTVWAETAKLRIPTYTALLKFGETGPPQQIDMTFGPNDGKDRLETFGLIEFADDRVRICFEFRSDAKRPEAFAVGKYAEIWELRRKPNADLQQPASLLSPERGNNIAAERSSASLRSYQEFAKKLGSMNSSVADAEENLVGTERLAERGERSSDDVTKARRRVAEAIRDRKAIQDEYAAVLRDLELQIESAQAEVDATKSDAEGAENLVKAQQAPTRVSVEAQLRLMRATLTLERLKVRYDLYKKAGEGAALGADPAKPSLPSPDELQAQLKPFATRVTAAAESVRKLEVTYFHDRSNTAELKQALKELAQARSEWGNRLNALEPTFNLMALQYDSAKLLGDSLGQKLEAVSKQLAEGKATEADLNAAAEAWKRASESAVTTKSVTEKYQTVFEAFRDAHPDNAGITYSGPAQYARPQPGHDPDIALAWLEAATGLKLEFVRFDDLQLWFKAALRVRESGSRYKAGDLIVVLNNQLFESLDQAVDALSQKSGSFDDIVLPGGLAGHRDRAHFDSGEFNRYLNPGHPDKKSLSAEATIDFELRVRAEATNTLTTLYVLGTCVSPDGLVVIPVSSKSLATDEPLVAYGRIKGTARVVASDDAHGLTLVKLESPQQRLFFWQKCGSGKPAVGQRLVFLDGTNSAGHVYISDVGQPLPKPLAGNDAFVMKVRSDELRIPNGVALLSIENDVQGIAISSEASPVKREGQEDKYFYRHYALPAVHIEKLLTDYRKANAKQVAPEALDKH